MAELPELLVERDDRPESPETSESTEPVPRKKRKVIKSEGREMIARVFHFLQEEYYFMKDHNVDNCDLSPLANLRQRTAEATGVSERTVTAILREEKQLPSTNYKFLDPMSRRRRRGSKYDLDDKKKEIIKNTILTYYKEHDTIPTLERLSKALKEKIGFTGCMQTLRTMLLKMGYKWQKMGKNCKWLEVEANTQVEDNHEEVIEGEVTEGLETYIVEVPPIEEQKKQPQIKKQKEEQVEDQKEEPQIKEELEEIEIKIENVDVE